MLRFVVLALSVLVVSCASVPTQEGSLTAGFVVAGVGGAAIGVGGGALAATFALDAVPRNQALPENPSSNAKGPVEGAVLIGAAVAVLGGAVCLYEARELGVAALGYPSNANAGATPVAPPPAAEKSTPTP